MILIVPQLLMLTGSGAMKSLTSAGNDADERLLRKALPNALQVPAGKTPALVRLIEASPNSPLVGSRGASGLIGSVTVFVLTAPSASFAADRSSRLPQHGSELAE